MNNYNQKNRNQGGQRFNNQEQINLSPLDLPKNYVDEAEKIMQELKSRLTTSKIRNILSRISEIYNNEVNRTEDTLLPESESNLQLARIRIAYECGRDDTVKEFVIKTKLLRYIKGIGNSRKKFIDYARYMEALVAYHRLFGGKD